MKVAVLRETGPNESRVGLVPEGVKFLKKKQFEVVVEKDAGRKAGFLDSMYEAEGATIAPTAAATLAGAEIVLKVLPPTVEEVGTLAKDQILVTSLQPVMNLEIVRALRDAGVTTMAMDLMPRITRAQTMDILSSQATVSGYKAVLLGANAIGKFLPMLTTAAGTVRPAKTLTLGAGVAGLQVLATFRRLGAVQEAFDVRPAVKEQCESLGAKFLELDVGDMEDEGGYAKALSEDQHERELQLIADSIKDKDVVITTAQIPGRKAPILITKAMVESMKPGSAIVDLAAETGGNCELTKAGETVVYNEVQILGPVNLPASLPFHASQMFSKNLVTFVMEMVNKEDGALTLDWKNEVLDGVCVTYQNEVRHGPTREALG
ncbi:MAG: Re/Si-specific NAD(P)(+) transhydrogenase subunit alpha [Longimicrobiales bacterium]|nr:Re/Si-specific NAD(P)(+) transhydrogenase subunit alpha [Longimicrobiales bacterium]